MTACAMARVIGLVLVAATPSTALQFMTSLQTEGSSAIAELPGTTTVSAKGEPLGTTTVIPDFLGTTTVPPPKAEPLGTTTMPPPKAEPLGTTTMPPPKAEALGTTTVGPGGVGDEACLPENTIFFKPGSVRSSNLGSQGPQLTEAPFLVFGNVTYSGNDEQVVDLQIGVRHKSYQPLNSSINGLSGAYGIINVAVGTSVDLTFRFVDSETGAAWAPQHAFYMSFFDLDTGTNSTVESIAASGFQTYELTNTTEVDVTKGAGHSSVFTATQVGTAADNPTHPLGLTPQQMNRAISLVFAANTSEFNITLGAASNDTLPSGARNFMFVGVSSIVCAARGVCTSFKCPSSFDPRPNPSDIVCKSEACNDEDDTDTCCCSSDAASYTYDKVLYPKAFSVSQMPETFPDMAPGINRVIDMQLSNTSAYTSYNGTVHSWDYGKINVPGNSSVSFTFSFTDREKGEPFSLPAFRMAFFDLDDGPAYSCSEQLTIESLESYDLSNDTALQVSEESGKTTFTSGGLGDGADNPLDYPLATSQKAHSVMVTFPSASNFSITFAVGHGCTTGRNVLFSRPASIGYCRA